MGVNKMTRGSVNSPGRASGFTGDSINSFVTQTADSLPQTGGQRPGAGPWAVAENGKGLALAEGVRRS